MSITRLHFFKNSEESWSFYRSYGNGTMFIDSLPEDYMYEKLKEVISGRFPSVKFNDNWYNDPKFWFADDLEDQEFRNWSSAGVKL